MPVVTPPIPLINGRAYSHASVDIRIRKKVFSAVKEIKYKHNLEPAEMRANKAQALARTLGKYSAEGSIVFFRHEYDALVRELGPGYLAIPFDIVVSYRELGMPLVTDTICAARLKTNDTGSSGEDPTEVSCDLHVMGILFNGVVPYPGFLKV